MHRVTAISRTHLHSDFSAEASVGPRQLALSGVHSHVADHLSPSTTLGDFNNAHTPHWHGNTVTVAGQRTDVISVVSAQMVTADMVPENPGIWLYHCHISDHMLAGMVARYEVKER